MSDSSLNEESDEYSQYRIDDILYDMANDAHEKWKKSKDGVVSWRGRLLRRVILALRKPLAVLYIIGLCLFIVWYVVPTIGVLVLNISFISSSLVGYTCAPLSYGLMGSTTEYIFSLIQVIAACPYLQFYIYMVFSWVKQLVDVFSNLAHKVGQMGVEEIKSAAKEDKTKGLWQEINDALLVDKIREEGIPDIECLWYLKKLLICVVMVVYLWSMLVLFVCTFFYAKATAVMQLCIFGFYFLTTLSQLLCWYAGTTTWFSTIFNCDWCWKIARDNVYEQQSTQQVENAAPDENPNMPEPDGVPHEPVQSADTAAPDENYKWPDEGRCQDHTPSARQDENKEQETDDFDFETVTGMAPFMTLAKYILKTWEDVGNRVLRQVEVIIFTAVNITLVVFDGTRKEGKDNSYFVASIVLRSIFIPVVSHCNIFTWWHSRPQDTTINGSMILGIFGTAAIFILSLVLPFTGSHEYGRIEHLAPFDPNVLSFDHANRSNIDLYRCAKPVRGLDIPSIIGLTFGAYDVTRDATIFDREMGHFFGLDWKTNIDYSVHYCDYDIPFVTYDIKEFDTTVVAFRGFSSGVELGMWLEVLASHYIIPILKDMIPFGELIREQFCYQYSDVAEKLGFYFFQPSIVAKNYIQSVMNKLNELGLTKADNVVFAGVNIGGTIAKVVGMMSHHPVVSFLSAPAMNDFYDTFFDFEEGMELYVTNIYNENAMFSFMESGYAMNSGLPVVSVVYGDDERMIDSVKATIRTESVYRSFCTLGVMCHGDKYSQYCHNVVGEQRMQEINEYFLRPLFQKDCANTDL